MTWTATTDWATVARRLGASQRSIDAMVPTFDGLREKPSQLGREPSASARTETLSRWRYAAFMASSSERYQHPPELAPQEHFQR